MTEPSPVWAVASLTPMQQRVLGCIATYTESHGFAPTLRELAWLSGLACASAALYQVRRLQELGLVERGARRARTVRVTEDAA